MLQVLIVERNWIALLREKAAEDDGAHGWPPGHGVHGGNLNVLALGIRSRMSLSAGSCSNGYKKSLHEAQGRQDSHAPPWPSARFSGCIQGAANTVGQLPCRDGAPEAD